MALIGEMQYLTIGGNTYSIPTTGGSTIQITRNLTSGTKSATITVDGTSYELFAPTVPTNISAFTNDTGYITSADVPEGASAYTGTISAVSTSASTGTNNGFARGDHVHNITKTTIDSTLGTGSGTTKFYREDGTWATPAYTTNTDTKLQIAAVTSGTTYYPIVGANSTTAATRQYDATGIAYTGTNGTANGSNGNAVLALGNSTASTTANWKKGTVRLYGTTAYYTDLISGAPSGNRTITFPNATGTVALTSDIPTTLPASDVSAWAKAASKPTYTASEVGALASNTTYVSTVTTTAGTHSAITSKSGAVSFNVPTKTSHLTNDSGFITSFTDENVKNTTVTAATTYYLTGSTSSSTATGGLSKHAAIKAYVTADSGTGGSARIDLGNTTATTSAGGKEGIIRLYGTSATYYVDLKAGAPGANRTITFPNKTGTVALTDDIPTVSYPVTSVNSKTGAVSLTASDVGALASSTTYVSTITTSAGTHSTISSKSGAVSFNVPTKTSHLTNDSNFVTSSGVTSIATSSPISGGTITSTGTISHATSGVGNAVTTAGFYKFKYDTYGHVTGVSSVTASDITGLVTIPTSTSQLTNDSGFITSYTDTKVTQTPLNGTNSGRNVLIGYSLSSSGNTTADTNTVYKATYMIYNDYSPGLTLTNRSDSTKSVNILSTGLSIKTGSYTLSIGATTQTANRTINFPDKGGTVALTDDLSSFVTSSGVTSITPGNGLINGTSGSSQTAITGTGTISMATITRTNNTSTASPSHSGTFTTIDSITTDNYGRVTAVNTKTVTLPASGNTDTKVSTAAISAATTYYPVLGTNTTSAETKYYDATNLTYYTYSSGAASLRIGSSSKTGNLTLGGSGTQGNIQLYNGTEYFGMLTMVEGSTSNHIYHLPNKSGTIALTTDTVTKISTTVTLTVAGWSDYSQTVTANGVTTSNDVIITPAPESVEDYVDSGILCTAQASGSLTFQCSAVPESAVSVNVLILT